MSEVNSKGWTWLDRYVKSWAALGTLMTIGPTIAWAANHLERWKWAFFALLLIHIATTIILLSRLAKARRVTEDRPTPSFYAYTSDAFEGIPWRWSWRQGRSRPTPEAIADLHAVCPTCGHRIEPKQGHKYRVRTLSGPGDHEGGSVAPLTDSVTVFSCRYHCHEGCTDKTFGGEKCEVIRRRIRGRIERKARELGL